MSAKRLRRLGLPTLGAWIIWTAGCAAAGRQGSDYSEKEWSFQDRPAYHLETEHFDLYTTVADSSWRSLLPAFLEDGYRKYASLVEPGNASERLETYLFETRDEWERFTRQRFPARSDTYRLIRSGGFSEGTVSVCYLLGDRGATLAVLAHEGMHQYLSRFSGEPVPAWLNEGLATYCETLEKPSPFTSKGPSNFFRLNYLREALSTQSLIPLRELLGTDAGAILLGGESRRTKTYYAQSWALIAYLRHGDRAKYAGSFRNLLADLADGSLITKARAARLGAESPADTSLGEAVLTRYFTEDLTAFEQDYVRYLSELAEVSEP